MSIPQPLLCRARRGGTGKNQSSVGALTRYSWERKWKLKRSSLGFPPPQQAHIAEHPEVEQSTADYEEYRTLLRRDEGLGSNFGELGGRGGALSGPGIIASTGTIDNLTLNPDDSHFLIQQKVGTWYKIVGGQILQFPKNLRITLHPKSHSSHPIPSFSFLPFFWAFTF